MRYAVHRGVEKAQEEPAPAPQAEASEEAAPAAAADQTNGPTPEEEAEAEAKVSVQHFADSALLEAKQCGCSGLACSWTALHLPHDKACTLHIVCKPTNLWQYSRMENYS